MTDDVSVREVTLSELPAVLNVVDGAVLAVDTGRLRSAIDRGEVLVAATGGDGTRETAADQRILGALVLDGQEITAVAVRRRRRGQGIGSQLVESAATRHESLVADFEEDVRPFWESLDFSVEPAAESGRYRGHR